MSLSLITHEEHTVWPLNYTFSEWRVSSLAGSGSFIHKKPGGKLPDNSSSSGFGSVSFP